MKQNWNQSNFSLEQWSYWLVLMLAGLTMVDFTTGQESNPQETVAKQETQDSEEDVDLEEEVIICEHADALKIYQPDEKTEITILTGAVRIKMTNGFLHAKKVTMYKDIATETFQKTLAEGDVELRDKDIFATCYQAILNHLDNTVDLKEQVIVIQEDDRLEADHFVFNRRTGERMGDGNVKFRVRIRNSKQTTSPDTTTPPATEPTKIEEANSTENSDDDAKADPTN